MHEDGLNLVLLYQAIHENQNLISLAGYHSRTSSLRISIVKGFQEQTQNQHLICTMYFICKKQQLYFSALPIATIVPKATCT